MGHRYNRVKQYLVTLSVDICLAVLLGVTLGGPAVLMVIFR